MRRQQAILAMTAAVLAALSLLIVVGASHAYFDGCNKCYEMPGGGTACTTMWCGDPPKIEVVELSSLERCYRRCEKNNPPIPSPEPTRTATPPTRTIGKSCDYYVTTQRTITFPVQDEPTVLCIDPPLAPVPTPFIEVGTVNGGNASCADFWMQGYSPTGAVSEPSYGAQPGIIMARVPGRYYAFVVLKQANNPACQTLTVYVR